jgi:hypothetical protein
MRSWPKRRRSVPTCEHVNMWCAFSNCRYREFVLTVELVGRWHTDSGLWTHSQLFNKHTLWMRQTNVEYSLCKDCQNDYPRTSRSKLLFFANTELLRQWLRWMERSREGISVRRLSVVIFFAILFHHAHISSLPHSLQYIIDIGAVTRRFTTHILQHGQSAILNYSSPLCLCTQFPVI